MNAIQNHFSNYVFHLYFFAVLMPVPVPVPVTYKRFMVRLLRLLRMLEKAKEENLRKEKDLRMSDNF